MKRGEIFAWEQSADDVCALLNTSKTAGISDAEHVRRLETYGPNAFRTGKKISAFSIFINQFASPLIFILIGSAVITAILREWIDTAVIMLAVLVNAGLGFYQEYRAENTLQKLTAYIKERARVIRNGKEIEIDSEDVVPGDIVSLSYGMRIPADVRIISERDFAVDESILTGESLSVSKHIDPLPRETQIAERKNSAYAGTLVVEGYATAVVTETGNHTELGRIAELVSKTEGEKTPLQKALSGVAWIIFAALLLIVAGIFGLGIARGESVLSMLLISAAVAAGAVPEALPIALTVILAIGAERIAKKKGITRSLSATETLGSTTVVLTDKTGTLTKADMELENVLTHNDLLSESTETSATLSPESMQILDTAALALDVVVEDGSLQGPSPEFRGKALEVNIARAAYARGIPVLKYIEQKGIQILPFNSTNKFSIIDHGASKRVIMLGAPDVLIKKSTLSPDERMRAHARIEKESAAGRRLIGVAEASLGDLKKIMTGSLNPVAITQIRILGVISFRDPLRDEAVHAVRRIEELGARVVMVTGDLKGTAGAVARDIGWNVDEKDIMSGDEMARLNDAELLERLKTARVFARVTPEDKMRIGKLFQARGEVVAMTGDGVNDAPILKAADIGIALGAGSDVAKSAADLVLLDDNFNTIVAAIEEGRRILSNIRKTFVYLMTTALDEIILIGGSILAGLPLPLSALQIIWVNFFTESFPALSFAFDQDHERNRKKEKARKANDILDTRVKVLTLGIGTVTSLLLFTLYATLLRIGISTEEARSLLFICFASYILVASFSMRSLTEPLFSYPLFENKMLAWSVLFGLVFVVATVTVPGLQSLFGLVLPSLSLLWIPFAWIAFNISVVETAKWSFRHFVKN